MSEQVQTCPQCGRPMVERTTRRGPNAGSPFWGCSGYPGCRGIVPIGDSSPAVEDTEMSSPLSDVPAPTCPKCSSSMVRRQAISWKECWRRVLGLLELSDVQGDYPNRGMTQYSRIRRNEHEKWNGLTGRSSALVGLRATPWEAADSALFRCQQA